jgi:ADP-heptose:LPS heptosyltransferase
VKKMARSGSSHSSAGAQRPCGAADETASDKTERAKGSSNLGMFLKKSNMPSRILVVRPGALGDIILALPALQALAASHPSATLDVVGYPSVLRLAECTRPALPLRKVHSIDRALFAPLLGGPLSSELAQVLRSYDLVIAWIHDHSGDLLAKLGRLPIACLQANPYPSEGSGVHASEHLLHTLSPLLQGAHSASPDGAPLLEASPDAQREGRALLRRLGLEDPGFLAMHPGSGSARKNWPAERFAALLGMAEGAGRRVLVIEGPSDEEAVERLAQIVEGPISRAREPDLLTLTAILSRATAFVGNDSGVAHLAAATGTAAVTIFGPTDPVIWAPRGPRTWACAFETPVGEVWAELLRRSAAS